jgi:hypothetical protein
VITPTRARSGLASQMSDAWIDSRITAMRNSADQAIQNIGNALFQHRQMITKTVTAVDKTRKEFVVLRLTTY